MEVDPKVQEMVDKAVSEATVKAKADYEKDVAAIKSAKDKEISGIAKERDEERKRLSALEEEAKGLRVNAKLFDLFGTEPPKGEKKDTTPAPVDVLRNEAVKRGVPADILKQCETEKEVEVAIKTYLATRPKGAQLDPGGRSPKGGVDWEKLSPMEKIRAGIEERLRR